MKREIKDKLFWVFVGGFLIPLSLNIINVLINELIVPKVKGADKELSYAIVEENVLRRRSIMNPMASILGGLGGGSWYEHKLHVWNSGREPLRNTPFRLIFESDQTDFEVLDCYYSTQPIFDFGKITEDETTKTTRLFTADFKNPGNTIIMTCRTNEIAEARISGNAEGVKYNKVDIHARKRRAKQIMMFGYLIVLGVTFYLGFPYIRNGVKKYRSIRAIAKTDE